MNVNSINHDATNIFENTLATSGNSNQQSSKTGLSTFAELLGTSASSAASSTATGQNSRTNSPNQMLAQLMATFKDNGLQNEASTADPMSIG